MKRVWICLICLALLAGSLSALAEPTPLPTALPTVVPKNTAAAAPTAEPTAVPTPVPTAEPTSEPTAEPTPEPEPEPTPAFATPLKKGDKGEDVEALQMLLIEHNYLQDGADGDFGGKTEKAVRKAQEDAGLEQTGVADDETVGFIMGHYAAYEPSKDSDILMYSVECDPNVHLLRVNVKNTGRNRITRFTFKLYQCNSSKTSLGTFYGKRNTSTKKQRTEYWTTHTFDVNIGTGENDYALMMLSEGWAVTFSDGSTSQVTYFDNGAYARVVLSEFVTEDGKTHSANQKLYCQFR